MPQRPPSPAPSCVTFISSTGLSGPRFVCSLIGPANMGGVESCTSATLGGGYSGKTGASSVADDTGLIEMIDPCSSFVGEAILNRVWSKSGNMEPKSSASSLPSSMRRRDEGPADHRPKPDDVAGGDRFPVFDDPIALPNPTEARAGPLGSGR